MGLPMQADELFPSRENVVRGCTGLRRPHGRRGDNLLDAFRHLAQAAPAELDDHGFRVSRAPVRKDIDQGSLYLRSFGMAQLHFSELFQMIVKKPGMVDYGLKNEGFAAGNGRAMTAVDGARRQLRTCGHIGLVWVRPRARPRKIAGLASGKAVSVSPPRR